MGYVNTGKKWGTDMLLWNATHLEDSAFVLNDGNTKPITMMVGGVYRSALPTYTAGDAAVCHFTADGKLMVDTELTLDGSVIINNLGGAAVNDAAIAGNPVQVGYYAANFDGAALPGAVNADGDVIYPKATLSGVPFAMLVGEDGSKTVHATDDSAQVATPDFLNVGGEYRAAATTYTDGDATILQTDVSGHLMVSSDTVYAEDSAHTTADEGNFILGVRNDALASLSDTDGDYSPLQVDASGATYVNLGTAAGSPQIADDSAQAATPFMLNVGGEYRAAPTTYADGDATILQTNVNGALWTVGTINEDVAHTNGDPGNFVLAVRNDTASALAGTDGDYIPFTTDALGNLRTVHTDSAGNAMPAGDAVGRSVFAAIGDGTTTAYVNPSTAGTEDEAQASLLTSSILFGYDSAAVANSQLKAVTVAIDNTDITATPNVLVGGGIYKNALDTYNDNDAVPLHFDVNGKLFTAGTYAEDTAHVTADWGTQVLAVRNDTLAALADTDGDYAPLQVDASGALYVNLSGEGIDLDVEGGVAHDAADAGNPLKTGGRARTSQIAAVANDDRTDGIFNVYGEQVLAGYTWATQSLRVEEIDPIPEKYVSETLAAVTNGADGTYYYYFDMNSFRYFAIQSTLNGGSGTATMTCEATIQDDGTAPASCTYIDVTNDLFGVASTTASDMWVADEVNAFKYVRVKIVAATGAADDADWTLYLKKLY